MYNHEEKSVTTNVNICRQIYLFYWLIFLDALIHSKFHIQYMKRVRRRLGSASPFYRETVVDLIYVGRLMTTLKCRVWQLRSTIQRENSFCLGVLTSSTVSDITKRFSISLSSLQLYRKNKNYKHSFFIEILASRCRERSPRTHIRKTKPSKKKK